MRCGKSSCGVRSIMLPILLVVCAVVLNGSTAYASTAASRTTLLDNLFGPTSNYNPLVRPDGAGGKITVKIGFHMTTMSSPDFRLNQFSMIGYMWWEWQDSRLAYDPSFLAGSTKQYLTIDIREKIWKPDIYFTEMIDRKDIFDQNSYVRLYPNGTVFTSIHTSVTLSNPMDVSDYPFSILHLRIIMESYGYDKDEIEFAPLKAVPFTIDTNIGNANTFGIEVEPYEIKELVFETGTFSAITFRVKFKFTGLDVLINKALPTIIGTVGAPVIMIFRSGRSMGKRLMFIAFMVLGNSFYSSLSTSGIDVPYNTWIDDNDIISSAMTLLCILIFIGEYQWKRRALRRAKENVTVERLNSQGQYVPCPFPLSDFRREELWSEHGDTLLQRGWVANVQLVDQDFELDEHQVIKGIATRKSTAPRKHDLNHPVPITQLLSEKPRDETLDDGGESTSSDSVSYADESGTSSSSVSESASGSSGDGAFDDWTTSSSGDGESGWSIEKHEVVLPPSVAKEAAAMHETMTKPFSAILYYNPSGFTPKTGTVRKGLDREGMDRRNRSITRFMKSKGLCTNPFSAHSVLQYGHLYLIFLFEILYGLVLALSVPVVTGGSD